MTNLSTRAETAAPEEMMALLGELVDVLRPVWWDTASDRRKTFWQLASIPEAHLAAALMLVPEGWTWDCDATAPECGIDWTLHHCASGRTVKGIADTPALALIAAIARSLGLRSLWK